MPPEALIMASRDTKEASVWRSETLPQLRPDELERLVAAFLARTEANILPGALCRRWSDISDRPRAMDAMVAV
jgi:hypothetical protein